MPRVISGGSKIFTSELPRTTQWRRAASSSESGRAVVRLAASPAVGRPGRVPGKRELVIPRTPYIVPYRIKGEVVQIITILHSAQRWPDRFP